MTAAPIAAAPPPAPEAGARASAGTEAPVGFEALLAAQTQTQDEPGAEPAAPENAGAVSDAATPAEALLAAMIPLVAGASQSDAPANDETPEAALAFAPGAMSHRPAALPEQAQGLATGRPEAPGAQGLARSAQAEQAAQAQTHPNTPTSGRGRPPTAASAPAAAPLATDPIEPPQLAPAEAGDAPAPQALQVQLPPAARPQSQPTSHSLPAAFGPPPETQAKPQDEAAPPPLPDAASGVGAAARAAAHGDGGVADAVKAAISEPAPIAAEAAPADPSRDGAARPGQADAPAATASASVPAHPAIPTRGAPETVAQLSAQILKKLDERTTRFDLELAPAGLGRVDVRLEIGAHGRLTAALAFDNPQAAAEVRGRAHELTRALEQAGFDLSGGVSFDVAGDRGRQGQGEQSAQSNSAWRGQAFAAALEAAGEADLAATPLSLQRRSHAGFDIRI